MTNHEIQMIPAYQLYPHPDNPRKDLGDLEELTASIRKNGILQNLTVVKRLPTISGNWNPDAPEYTVVIGHRRLAAAKAAGVYELPCIVAEMDEAEQFSTMMVENMARADLTPIEEADGFQMMLDLGDTKEQISEKTGLSRSTIDRRLKLRELDRDKLETAQERGATLLDYMEICKIENPKSRDKLLDSIGTNNFKNDLSREIENQEREKTKRIVLNAIEKFAQPFPDGRTGDRWNQSKYEKVAEYEFTRCDPSTIEAPNDGEKYFYYCDWFMVSVYKKLEGGIDNNSDSSESGKDPVEPIEVEQYRTWFENKKKELDDMLTRHANLRHDFINSMSPGKCTMPGVPEKIMSFLMECISGYCIEDIQADSSDIHSALQERFGEDWSKSKWEIDDNDREYYIQDIKRDPYSAALYSILYLCGNDHDGKSYDKDYSETWSQDPEMRNYELKVFGPDKKRLNKKRHFYAFLKDLGYEASEEEIEAINDDFYIHINDDAPEIPESEE